MTEQPLEADSGTTSCLPQISNEKIESLLKAKDDTSRFVGLALLKLMLEDDKIASDPGALKALWESVSPKFLDRLLRAYSNEKLGQGEAKDMVDLAVAVIHAFTVLLPIEARRNVRLTRRIEPLIKVLNKR